MTARVPPLIPVCVAFLIGIALAGSGWLPAAWMLATLGMLGLLALAALAIQRPGAGLAVVCAAAALLGWSRYMLAEPAGPDPLERLHNQGKVTMHGTVVQPPDAREHATNLIVEVSQITSTLKTGTITPTLVLVKALRFSDITYGDVVTLTGELRQPPTGVDFSYRDYLARQGIHSLIEYAVIRRVASGQGNPFFAALYGVRDSAQGIIEHSLPEPQASLLSGILLGQDQGIPRDTVAAFQRTSTTHIIAISGYNISLVAGFLATLGGVLLHRRRVALFVLGGIAAYALFVGGGASVVRAAIMGALLVIGPALGRQSYAPNALAAAALAMAVQSPFIVWDIGFQLSAGATLGILLFAAPLSDALSHWIAQHVTQPALATGLGLLAADTTVTIAAMLAVEPLIVYYFHGLSLVSLPVNLLILPVQPAVIGFGTLVVLGGWLHPLLGQALGWLAWLPLTWTIAIVEWWARLPFASFDAGRVPPQAVAAYYAVLAGIVWLGVQRTQPRPVVANGTRRIAVAALAALAAAVILAWFAVFAQSDTRLHVWFLDVGQGDAVLVRTPSGRFALIDGGPSPQAAVEALGRQMPFYRRDLSLIVLTRATDDHVAGLVPVAERYAVAQVIAPDVAHGTTAVRRWSAALKDRGVSVMTAADGVVAELGDGVHIAIAHAGKDEEGLTVRLEYAAFSIHFDGDGATPAPGEAATVLRIGAHGGARKGNAQLLRDVQPTFAVISVGGDNRSGDPAPETLQVLADAGATLYRTDRHGTIEFISDGGRLWVTSQK
ncbi:MAG: ComEC/Rec2 family competence protein [Chloroflexi bacterium]|nr:ComEC/Rec2 family competence protein [Chloroflexota bacterium]